MTPAALNINWELACKLVPGGHAVKILVEPRSPASKAHLRTGDYVVSVSPSPTTDMSFADFEARCLPVGTDAFVKFHSPGRGRTAAIELAVLRLRKRPGQPKPPWWRRVPRVGYGAEVARDERARFEAQMATHPFMPALGFRLLVRLLRHYDGPQGAYPSYAKLARDVGCRRRQTALEHVACLARLGVVEIIKGGGAKGKGGTTNLFVIHWPDGWGGNVVKLKSRE